MLLVFFSLFFVALGARDELEVPSNVAVRTVGVKGLLLCGNKPLEGARVRLYRVQQFGKDDQRQILDERLSLPNGHFRVEGTTKNHPKNETELYPWISVHHQCAEDLKTVKKGYRRFNIRIPDSYVMFGERPMRLYDFGTLNVELGVHGEFIDQNYIPNPNAKLTDERPSPIGGKHDLHDRRRTTTQYRYNPYGNK